MARVEALQAMAATSEPRPRFATLDDERDPDDEEEDQVLAAWDLGLRDAHRSVRSQAASRKPTPEVTFGATLDLPPGAPRRRWLALAVVGVLMAAAVSSVYALYRPAIAAESAGTTDARGTRGSGPRPLELLSLRHTTDSSGAFTVTGLVQNPPDGQTAHKIVAVVYLFDRDGNYSAGGKAALDFTVLQPGEESPFVVQIPGIGRVSRYRVGFRTEEGGVVAHVDRRGQLPGGTTGGAIDPSPVQHSAARRPEGRP
jgi:hypothetical protein